MTANSPLPQRVREVLEQEGLDALTFEPGSTPTSPQAAERIGCAVGQIAKSMLVKGKDGRFRLLVCPGDRRIDNRKLKSLLGVKARMATAEETFTITGYRPGGVCPFDLHDIDIFIDQGLAAYDLIYPAAGTDASGVPITFTRLQQITAASMCDIMSEPG